MLEKSWVSYRLILNAGPLNFLFRQTWPSASVYVTIFDHKVSSMRRTGAGDPGSNLDVGRAGDTLLRLILIKKLLQWMII